MDQIGCLILNSKQINSFHTFKDHEFGVSDFCQNKQKPNELASVSFDATVKIYDLDKMEIINNLTNHKKGVWTCDFTNNYMLTGGNDNSIIIWDSMNYKPISTLNIHEEVIYDVKFSENGKLFASCSKGMICLWDVANTKQPVSIIKDQPNDFIYSVNFLDFDKYILTGFIDGYLLMADVNNIENKKKYYIPIDADYANRVEEKSVIKPSEEKGNVQCENAIYHISKFKNKPQLVDDEFLTTLEDGSIWTWKLEDDELKNKTKYAYFTSPVTSVNSSFDDSLLVASGKDHSAVVWECSQYNKIGYSLVGHTDVVTCANFISNDVVVTSSYDASLRLWKLN